MTIKDQIQKLQPDINAITPKLIDLYKDFHQNPELSMQEVRTAGIVADHLKKLGYEVHEKIGVTGVIGILKNGEGQTVMLRADMDALPMAEKTGLDYASKAQATKEDGTVTDVAHMCGHDLHTAWLMGVTEVLANNKDAWNGTLMAVFQPGEEEGTGAMAMVKDMDDKFPKPDIILGQHVMVGEAGSVMYKSGIVLSAADSFHVKITGKGAHGSMPQNAIDPVMMAAYTAVRLQSVVSREISPLDGAVLTIGAIQAGTKENIIPDDAMLKLNMRSYKESVRQQMIESMKRICQCECHASNAPVAPEFTQIDSYPSTENDVAATEKLEKSFIEIFADKAIEIGPQNASEDFSNFGRSWNVPYVFWFIGSTEPSVWDAAVANNTINQVPANHSSLFKVELDPTVQKGLEAMLVAALTWLTPEQK